MKLKAILSDKLTDEELGHLVQSYDVVGDIAIIIVPPELVQRELTIAHAMLDANPTIRVVAKRVGNYGGEYRTIELKIIAGENRKETIHREFGLKFMLNPELVYFSVRSSSERKRVADLVTRGETVLVMFSGIAPYPLHIAKFSEANTIIGIELNEAAHQYAQKNLELNKIRGRVHVYHGDVSEVTPKLGLNFDRIVMPLPKSGSSYLSCAIKQLNPDGSLHYYVMQSPETVDHAVVNLSRICEQAGRTLVQSNYTVCGHTGPRTYRYCIDALIS